MYGNSINFPKVKYVCIWHSSENLIIARIHQPLCFTPKLQANIFNYLEIFNLGKPICSYQRISIVPKLFANDLNYCFKETFSSHEK